MNNSRSKYDEITPCKVIPCVVVDHFDILEALLLSNFSGETNEFSTPRHRRGLSVPLASSAGEELKRTLSIHKDYLQTHATFIDMAVYTTFAHQ